MKKQKALSVTGCVGYCITTGLLILSLSSYIPFTFITAFDVYFKKAPLFYSLIDNGPLGEHGATVITGLILPMLSMIITGIYYLIIHKKYKRFPSKTTFIVWLFFLGFYIFAYVSLFSDAPWNDFLNEYIWYPYLTLIMIFLLIVNTVDFISLTKSFICKTSNEER